MKTVQLIQGSPEWLAHRRNHFNASDAPAMMAVSSYKSRDQLIKELATGVTPDVDAATQYLFDEGHRFEALARPLAIEIVGEALYPMVGVDGKFSASFDGLTMDESVSFEHKTLNEALRSIVNFVSQDLPIEYRVQMDHQMMVSGSEKTLFMASKWDGDTLIEERHCWYAPDLEIRAKIVAGWAQLELDVVAYVPVESAVTVIGKAPETLPALFIQLSGEVKASNLVEFKQFALTVFSGINKDLKTDSDFANAAKTVKWCEDVEARLLAAKQHALSQTKSIDDLFIAIDSISAESKKTRLELDKLVTARKESIKGEIVAGGIAAFRAHVDGLNARLGKPYMPTIAADFAGVIKGKRTIDSLNSAVNDELARAKIAANEAADRIQTNLGVLREKAINHVFLFADTAQIVTKANDDFEVLVSSRIATHEVAEAARLEREREAIRAQERVKLEAEQAAELRAKEKAEQVQQDKEAAEAALSVRVVVAEPLPKRALPDVVSTIELFKAVSQPLEVRPTDAQIVEVLTLHFRVHESKVIEWLTDLNFDDLTENLMEAS